MSCWILDLVTGSKISWALSLFGLLHISNCWSPTLDSFLGWHWVNSTCTVLNGEIVRTTHGAYNLEKFEPGWLTFFDYNPFTELTEY